jgi:hypothetical protein
MYMHHPSYTSVESYAVSENFSNYRTKGQKLEKKERRPQEEATRHENTGVDSKALLRLCRPLPWRQYSYKILKNSIQDSLTYLCQHYMRLTI